MSRWVYTVEDLDVGREKIGDHDYINGELLRRSRRNDFTSDQWIRYGKSLVHVDQLTEFFETTSSPFPPPTFTQAEVAFNTAWSDSRIKNWNVSQSMDKRCVVVGVDWDLCRGSRSVGRRATVLGELLYPWVRTFGRPLTAKRLSWVLTHVVEMNMVVQ